MRVDRDGGGRRRAGGGIGFVVEGALGGRAGALQRWDSNGNGRITCREARAHSVAPVRRDHPAYPLMRDGDGVVCE